MSATDDITCLTAPHVPADWTNLDKRAVETVQRAGDAAGVAEGAHVLADGSNGEPQDVLIATGSQPQMAAEARKVLDVDGVATCVVSMPSYVGDLGRSTPIEHHGASADDQTLYREFGLTTEAVVDAARRSLQRVEESK